MNSILKNYLSTILLLAGIVAGGVAGILMGPSSAVFKPVGEIFLNMIFVLVVPLVFFSIAQAMCNMKKKNLIGRMLGATVVIFLLMSLIAGLLSYATFRIFDPFEGIRQVTALPVADEAAGSAAEAIVRTFTVPDFPLLLSKSNLLPLIIFAAVFGLGTAYSGAEKIAALLDEGMQVVMKMMELVMCLAPIGLGCYFADMLGRLGGQILESYLGVFVLYSLLALFVYAVVHSLYVLAFKGNLGVFWKNMVTPSLTAIATCSSAASMPSSIKAAKDMGVDDSVAEAVIPLGVNLHKDGSVMTSVAKILFALVFFGQFHPGPGTTLTVIGLSILVSVVVGAVPIGGMTAEILICSVLGLDPAFAATLMVIGTITDIPATLVNLTANITGAVLVDKAVISKNS